MGGPRSRTAASPWITPLEHLSGLLGRRTYRQAKTGQFEGEGLDRLD